MTALDERLDALRCMAIVAHRAGRFSADERELLDVMERQAGTLIVLPPSRARARILGRCGWKPHS